jgi:hypothetical protein
MLPHQEPPVSSPYHILIRTHFTISRVRDELGRALKPIGVNLDISPIDDEDACDAQRFFQLKPNLSADVASGRAGQDGAIFVAVILWARDADAHVAILLDWDLLVAMRERVLYPVPGERQFFEREVLRHWNGPVSWSY